MLTIVAFALPCLGFLILGFIMYDSHQRNIRKIRRGHRSEIAVCRRDLAELDGQLSEAQRRAFAAEVVVETLTNDLARERRSNTLLRTGILDAEREVGAMAEALALPVDLAERRAR